MQLMAAILVASGSGNLLSDTNYMAAVFDPTTGTVTTQAVGWDMFCNGMIVLPDGRPFVMGGTLQYDPFFGEVRTSAYDPATGSFVDSRAYVSRAVVSKPISYNTCGRHRDDFLRLGVRPVVPIPPSRFTSLDRAGASAVCGSFVDPTLCIHGCISCRMAMSSIPARRLAPPSSKNTLHAHTWTKGVSNTKYRGTRT